MIRKRRCRPSHAESPGGAGAMLIFPAPSGENVSLFVPALDQTKVECAGNLLARETTQGVVFRFGSRQLLPETEEDSSGRPAT